MLSYILKIGFSDDSSRTWMPLINGVDGGCVPGTLCFLLLSDPNLCAEKVFPLFHVRSILSLAHGQGQQRIHSGAGTESNLSSYKFLLYQSLEIRSGDLWAFDKFPSALIPCSFFSPSEFKGCLLQSCTALVIYGCLWGCQSSNFNSDRLCALIQEPPDELQREEISSAQTQPAQQCLSPHFCK